MNMNHYLTQNHISYNVSYGVRKILIALIIHWVLVKLQPWHFWEYISWIIFFSSVLLIFVNISRVHFVTILSFMTSHIVTQANVLLNWLYTQYRTLMKQLMYYLRLSIACNDYICIAKSKISNVWLCPECIYCSFGDC